MIFLGFCHFAAIYTLQHSYVGEILCFRQRLCGQILRGKLFQSYFILMIPVRLEIAGLCIILPPVLILKLLHGRLRTIPFASLPI